MNQSTSIGALSAALSAFQGEMKTLAKNRVVKTKTYSFPYATFESMVEKVLPILAKNGLALSQGVVFLFADKPDRMAVSTMLSHSSGEWRSNIVPIIAREEGMQAFGSAISYGKRYGLSALLGVVSDEDDDGNAADGQEATITPRQAPARAKNTEAPAATEPPPLLKEVSNLAKEKKVGLKDILQQFEVDPRKMDTAQLEATLAWLKEK